MRMIINPIQTTHLRVIGRSVILLCYISLSNLAFGQSNLLNKKIFVPDTTINRVLKLLNPQSILGCIGNQRDNLIEDENAARVQLSNKHRKEYLILYQLPASKWNTFNEFEVGTIRALDTSYKPSSFSSFSTESGITLGMTMDSLIALKGRQYSRSIDGDRTVLTYRLQEDGNRINGSIFERYNMPEYKATYYFIKSRLVKFIFGFPNP